MSFKFLFFWPNWWNGERTDELTGIGAKYACLSIRPLFLLDGVSMGETDDPVDDHKGESQSGVVHQGEPGHFFAFSVIFVKQQTNYKDRLSQVTAKCLSFSLVLGVYVSLLVSLLAHISCLTEVIELIENCNILTCHKICQFFNL